MKPRKNKDILNEQGEKKHLNLKNKSGKKHFNRFRFQDLAANCVSYNK